MSFLTSQKKVCRRRHTALSAHPKCTAGGRFPFGKMLFLWIWRLYARAAKQIIDADAVEISQRDERVYGIIQRTDLVLRIGILADVQQLRDLLLCVIMVDPQIADILVFQNFLSHEITRHELIVSGNQILHFI